ncbi:MAG: putative lipopolysaccharide heptosyltransferase III [Deltaproteobacteria bacterium]|nr:putative lipopolysaccharide heptosyltransferase III [Deltaproteobacteria bacterium]
MKSPVKKILVIVTRQIGDVLLTTPFLRSLKGAFSTAKIDVLLFKGTEGILVGNPDINTVIPIDKHPGIKEALRLIKQIFRHYDLAISVLSGDRPMIYAFLAAPKRISIVPPYRLHDAWKRWITTKWTELDDWDTHTVIQNLRLCDLLGIKREYHLVIPESPTAQDTLRSLLPFRWPDQPYAVFHMVPRRRYKYWTLEGWVQLSRYLAPKGTHVVITGGGDEEEMDYVHSAIAHMPENVTNLAGKLTFAEVATLIQSSKIYVGPDTVVTHLAAATGKPTIALFGPTNPVKWAPWPFGYHLEINPFSRKGTQRVGNVLLIQGPGDCVPCHKEGCEGHRQSKSRCMENLNPETVIQGIERMLHTQFLFGVSGKPDF